MNILYMAEDYDATKVHHNLCHHVAKVLGEDSHIHVFCNSRKITTENIADFDLSDNYSVHLPVFTSNIHLYKYIYPYKIKEKYKKLKKEVDLSKIDIVHTATMFAEGGVALEIWKEYGIPYVIGVRGSDVNSYLKRAPHLWVKGLEILKHASKIVFISESSHKTFLNSFPIRHSNITLDTEVIPNAIDSYFLNNMASKHKCSIDGKLLYIGRFDVNKNVERLMDAVEILKPKYKGLTLTLIGGGGDKNENVLKRCAKDPATFKYLGKIYEKAQLTKIMRTCDIFTMVSHSETFGLVYVESLSQGLPIVFTKGQGVDGFFSEPVGETVNSRDVQSIADGIKKILTNYALYTISEEKLRSFSWSAIAEKYVDIYKKIINNK